MDQQLIKLITQENEIVEVDVQTISKSIVIKKLLEGKIGTHYPSLSSSST